MAIILDRIGKCERTVYHITRGIRTEPGELASPDEVSAAAAHMNQWSVPLCVAVYAKAVAKPILDELRTVRASRDNALFAHRSVEALNLSLTKRVATLEAMKTPKPKPRELRDALRYLTSCRLQLRDERSKLAEARREISKLKADAAAQDEENDRLRVMLADKKLAAVPTKKKR